MAKALRTHDLPAHQEHLKQQECRRNNAVGHRQRREALASKTFEELTTVEKDALLKLLALRMGLVKDSPDSE